MIDKNKPPNIAVTVNGTPVDMKQEERNGAAFGSASSISMSGVHLERVNEAAKLWADHFGKRGAS